MGIDASNVNFGHLAVPIIGDGFKGQAELAVVAGPSGVRR